MIWAAMSSASVGPLCFLKCSVNTAIYQEILEHFMLPSADKLYGDAGFIFQQDLAPAHTAEGALCTALPGKQFLLKLRFKTLQDVFIHLHTAWKLIFKNPY